MDEFRRKLDEIEDRMSECKDDLHSRMTILETGHLTKLITLETQMTATLNALKELVTKAQFEPVRLLTYGIAGGVLTTVMVAILAKVVIK